MESEILFCAACGRRRGWREQFCAGCGRAFISTESAADSSGAFPATERARRHRHHAHHESDGELASPRRQPRRWYQTEWAIILTLFFFFPAGLFLMWYHALWSRRTQKIIAGLLVWPLGAWWASRETHWPWWIKCSIWFAAATWAAVAIGVALPAVLLVGLMTLLILGLMELFPMHRDEGEEASAPARQPRPTSPTPARGEPAGRIADALRRYAQAGQLDRMRECLLSSLPDWPARSLLVAATEELFELESRVAAVPAEFVPRAMTSGLVGDAGAAADVLWRSADRIAAAATLSRGLPAPPEGLQRETEQLERLLAAIRDARREVAELPLSVGGSGEVDAVARSFQGLADAARGVRDELDALGPA